VCCGESYEHKSRSVSAVKVFSELSWPVKFSVIKGASADWPTGLEEEVLLFSSSCFVNFKIHFCFFLRCGHGFQLRGMMR
jgi:hypothetical protein